MRRLRTWCVSVALMCLPLSIDAADAERGKALYATRCSACHSIEENGPGPRHQGVVGCVAGTQPGFGYSPALSASRIVWDEATLDRWLANPDQLVPGNQMAVRLAPDPLDRADLIAFLRAAPGPRACKVPTDAAARQ